MRGGASGRFRDAVLSVAGGTAISVAIAWIAGAGLGRAGNVEPAPPVWPGSTPASWPSDPEKAAKRYGERVTGLGWTYVYVSASVDHEFSTTYVFERLRVGWPWRALAADFLSIRTGPLDARRTQTGRIAPWRRGVRLSHPFSLRSDPILPLVPLWSGLLLDSALYALGVYACCRYLRAAWNVALIRSRARSPHGASAGSGE